MPKTLGKLPKTLGTLFLRISMPLLVRFFTFDLAREALSRPY